MRARLPNGNITQDRAFLEVVAGTGITAAISEKTGKDDAISLTVSASAGGTPSRTYDVSLAPYNANVYTTEALARAGVDATAAINSAITDANTAGGGIVIIPGWVRVSTTVVMKSYVTLAGVGMDVSGIAMDDNGNDGVQLSGNVISTKTITTNCNSRERNITVTSSGYAAGDWLYISRASPYFRSWVSRALTVTPGTPDVIMMEDVNPSGGFVTGDSVTKFTPLFNATVRDMTIQGASSGVTATRVQALIMRRVVDCTVERVKFKGFGGVGGGSNQGIVGATSGCRRVQIHHCVSDGNYDVSSTPQQIVITFYIDQTTQAICSNNMSTRTGGSSNFSFTGTCHLVCADNNVSGHGFWFGRTLSDINRADSVASIASDNGGRGIKLPAGCSHFAVTGNSVANIGFSGIRIEDGSHGTISGNDLFAVHDDGIVVQASGSGQNGCDHVNIVGNKFHYDSGHNVSNTGPAIWLGANSTKCVVANNNISDYGVLAAIYVENSTDNLIAGNMIENGATVGIYLISGSTRNVITDNTIVNATSNAIDSGANSVGGNYIYANHVFGVTTSSLHGDDVRSGMPHTRRKGSDQSFNTITTATAITSTAFYAAANEAWTFDSMLFISNIAANTGGLKVAVGVPAGATLRAVAFGLGATTPTFLQDVISASATLTSSAFLITANNPGWVRITGTVVNGATAGLVSMMAAQVTSGDTYTVQTNSFITAHSLAS